MYEHIFIYIHILYIYTYIKKKNTTSCLCFSHLLFNRMVHNRKQFSKNTRREDLIDYLQVYKLISTFQK